MNAGGGILLVDDDLMHARSLARELTLLGWQVRVAGSGEEALCVLHAEQHTIAVVADLHMPDMDGISLLDRVRGAPFSCVYLLISACLDTAATVRAVRAGADDVLEKPIDAAALDLRLRSIIMARAERPARPGARTAATSPILGSAPAIRAVREQVRTVARYRDLPVLITGETGTGKELVAQAVHAASETDGPFVPVNCAAIPEHLFESELFGHDAGAFTGARGARAGLFEVASTGTLFLDEIGELPSALQPKLLRALETRSFRRVGGNRDLPFHARVISATHRNLTSPDTTHRQHLEATARLLAGVAHDVRSAVASIIYSADFLDERGTRIGEEVLRATVHDIGAAARRLQLTVDSLLDYARLGPTISVPVSLHDVLSRAQGLLRSFFRDGAHGLRIDIGEGAEWVRGNPVVVEQIFVNLLLSVAERAEAPSQFSVSSRRAAPPTPRGGATVVQVCIVGNGQLFTPQVADPAAETPAAAEHDGLRLALADAETAAAAQGGVLTCERGADGSRFVVRLPRSEGPR